MPSPAAWKVLVGVESERILRDPVGIAGFAYDPHICSSAGLSYLLEFED